MHLLKMSILTGRLTNINTNIYTLVFLPLKFLFLDMG